MTAKEYLNRYREKCEEYEFAKKQYELNGSTNGILYDRMCAASKEKAALYDEIQAAVSTIPDSKIRAVLEERYLRLHSYSEIAEAFGCSKDTIFRLCKKGYKKLQNCKSLQVPAT